RGSGRTGRTAAGARRERSPGHAGRWRGRDGGSAARVRTFPEGARAPGGGHSTGGTGSRTADRGRRRGTLVVRGSHARPRGAAESVAASAVQQLLHHHRRARLHRGVGGQAGQQGVDAVVVVGADAVVGAAEQRVEHADVPAAVRALAHRDGDVLRRCPVRAQGQGGGGALLGGG